MSGAVQPLSAKLVWPAAVHTYALDAANADQLNAYIVATVAFIGKRDEASGGGVEVGSAGHKRPEFFIFQRAMQPIGAKNEEIAGDNLVLAR